MGIRINNSECAWGDINIYFLGHQIRASRAISYNPTKEKEALMAAGRNPWAIQHGGYKYEGSVTVLQSALDRMDAIAKSAGYDSILDVDTDIIVSYSVDGTLVNMDRVVSASFTGWTKSASQDTKFMEIELPFIALGVETNI